MIIIKHEKNAAGDDIPVDDLVYRSKPIYSTNLKENINITFRFKDGEEAVFEDAKSLQDFLDKMNNFHELENRMNLERQLYKYVLEENAKLNERIEKLEKLLKECREVIYNLIDDEPCWLDHHGYCQTHGWMSEDLCPNEGGKELLTKIDEALK